MACNCGRRAVVRQSPGPVTSSAPAPATTEALVASATTEVVFNQTDPATGAVVVNKES